MKKFYLPIGLVIFLILAGALLFLPAKTSDIACKIGLPSLSLTTFAVVCGAAVDAINPCEFAILILLMASILIADNTRRKALITGFSFTAAVFIAYFLMGIGLLEFIRTYTLALAGYFYKIVGAFAIIIGALNIKDYISYGAGGFIMEVPQSWRPKMKELVRGITNPWGGFLIGLLVSLFLLPCTAGPYVVILGLLAAKTNFSHAFLYLILYNIIFIAPMVAIVFAMYFGLPPEKAENWRKEKIRLLHLIAGIVLILLGVVLLGGWI